MTDKKSPSPQPSPRQRGEGANPIAADLRAMLDHHGVAHDEFYKAVGISRPAGYRLLTQGAWPKRDREAPARVLRFVEALKQQPPATTPENAFGRIWADFDGQKNPHPDGSPSGASLAASQSTTEDSMLLRFENLTPAAKKHFALTRSPFADDIHTREDVFLSPHIRYVRAALHDAAVNHGFVAIVGESGAGKSLLVEELEQRILDENRPVVVIRPYIVEMEENDQKGKTLKSGAIAEAIIRALDPTAAPRRTRDARWRQVHELLKSARAAGVSPLLLIEEAHCLPFATLKHLKRLLELKQGLSRLLGIALIGQPELKARLAEQKAEVREVVQRCEVVELAPLDNDLESYLKHKFQRAGADLASVLAPEAVDAIRARLVWIPRGGKATDAISMCYPLVVGNLVTRAMNAAAGAGWPKVDGQVIAGV
ncbi:MAG: AAA family ATPase [Betaproteobacteria bacterium]|nr:AAA family ATPase [Betaproteobacteria bacterium]MCL2886522.1 AAA family ATPase [Betaproteobacteria bacterium]